MVLYGSMPAAPRPATAAARGFVPQVVLGVTVVALIALVGFHSSSVVMLESKDPLDDGGLPTSVVMRSMGKVDTKTTLSSKASHSDKPVISNLKQLSSLKVKDTTGRPTDDADADMSDGELAVLEEAAQPLARNSRSLGDRLNERVDREFAAKKREKAQKLRHYKSELDNLNQGFAEQMQKALTGSADVGDVTAVIDTHSANYLHHTAAFGKKVSLQTDKAILASAENQNAKEKKGLVKAEGHGLVHTTPHHERTGILHTEDGYVLKPFIAKAARTTSLLARELRAPAAAGKLHMHSVGIADSVNDGEDKEEEEDPRLSAVDGCACDGPANEDAGPRCSCIGDPEFVKPDDVFSSDEITTWKAKSAQMLKNSVAVTERNPQVLPTADSIDAFLQDLLERVDTQATGSEPADLTAQLETDLHHLQSLAARDPQSRDLIARRLTKLNRILPAGSQQLLDFDTVYIPPYVDDLDDYLAGVIAEVENTEIPNLDEEEEKGSPQQLKSRDTQTKSRDTKAPAAVLPTLFAISFEVNRLLKASTKLHPATNEEEQEKATHLERTAQSLMSIVTKLPEARDLVAEKLSLLKKASRVTKAQPKTEAGNSQKLLDYDTVYIAPYVDDLDDYLAAVIAEVESTEIPNLDEEEEKARPQSLAAVTGAKPQAVFQSLGPLPYMTQNIFSKSRADFHGEYEDKMEWQHHAFDTPPEERPNAAKRFGDHWGDTQHTMVHKAHSLRYDPADTNPVHHAWGYDGADVSEAEAPAQSADGPDTARSPGVQTQRSLMYGDKLCQLVNCYNEDAIPFPRAARWARYQGLKEATSGKPRLGDEIFDLGVSGHVNDGDVMVPADSESVSSSIFTAHKPLRSVRKASSGVPVPL